MTFRFGQCDACGKNGVLHFYGETYVGDTAQCTVCTQNNTEDDLVELRYEILDAIERLADMREAYLRLEAHNVSENAKNHDGSNNRGMPR